MRATAPAVALAGWTLLAGATSAEAVSTGRSFPGPDRSPDGLELADFTVKVVGRTPQVGQGADVVFKLTNVSGGPIAFGEKGIFVAVRWSRPGDAGGREEGFVRPKAPLQPGQTVTVHKYVTFDGVGRWTFWPAYELVRGASPSPWHPLELDVVEAPREERRLGYCANVETLPDGIALLGFSVFGPTPLRVGDQITIEYHLQNRTRKTVVFGAGGVSAVARGRGKERAFGNQLPGGELAPDRPDKALPVEARLQVDAPGEWHFRPMLDLGDHKSPPAWCDVAVQVAP
jgi:hypothetical protein